MCHVISACSACHPDALRAVNSALTTGIVQVRGLQKCALEFRVAKLHGKIVPEESFAKIMKTKILVKLKKAPKPPKADDGAESALNEDTSDGDDDLPGLTPVDTAVDVAADTAAPEGVQGSSEDALQKAQAEMAGTDLGADAAGASEGSAPPAQAGDVSMDSTDSAAVMPGRTTSGTVSGAQSEVGTDGAADALAGVQVSAAAQQTGDSAPPKAQYAHWYKLRAD